MNRRFRSKSYALPQCLFVLLGASASVCADAPPVDQTGADAGLVQQYRKAASLHLKALEVSVGRWEFSFDTVVTSYNLGRSGSSATNVRKFFNRTIFDERLGGIRSDGFLGDGKSIAPDSKATIVNAINPEYSFEVGNETRGPLAISGYSLFKSDESRESRWLQQLSDFYGTVALDFNGSLLLRLLDTGEGRITSATRLKYENKDCVEFVTQRDFINTGVKYTVSGKVVVDPAQHWAVVYYEEAFMDPRAGRRSSIKYNPSVTNIAFPQQITLEDHNNLGQVVTQSTVTFAEPRPSQAKAEDFTLEAFGLERPINTAAPPASRTTRAFWMNGVIGGFLALVAGCMYLRLKRAVPNGKQ